MWGSMILKSYETRIGQKKLSLDFLNGHLTELDQMLMLVSTK